MNIDSIENGYVIDHIKAGDGMKIYDYLKLGDLDCQVALIKNARSKKLEKKDIIKIDRKIYLNFGILAYIDSNITVNVIENGERINKFHPELEGELVDIVKCKNPRCITTSERNLKQIAVFTDKVKRIYRCRYCEGIVNI